MCALPISGCPEAPVADDQPLGLPGLRGLFRKEPCHRCGRAQGRPERGRSQARHPLRRIHPVPCLHRCVQECMQKVSMSDSRLRFPAEWEPQSAILIAWPHAGPDWAERLAEVEETCIALVAAITRFQRALVCVADDDVEAYARGSEEHTSELQSLMRTAYDVFCLNNKNKKKTSTRMKT